ncbi:30S ribosomal protein S5 [bacterium]|nr:30S ribosomal protein S5 [bacterium]MCP5463261.1 30S ribosomal protein S5 [bacterium]
MEIRNLEDKTTEYTEIVISVNRCAKVVKGGRRFSFSALVVVGDKAGNAGYGFGKANEVAEAIRKAIDKGKKSMVSVPLDGATIPHEVIGEYGAGKVLLRPAAPGTGVIAGGAARSLLEAAGVHDILCKSLGSDNSINVVKATMEALKCLRSKEQVFKMRGLWSDEVE